MGNKAKIVVILIVAVVAGLPLFIKVTHGDSKAGASNFTPTMAPPVFVNDPEALGAWKSIDFVGEIGDFAPGQQKWTGDLYPKGLELMPEGRTSGPWQWSKEVLWHPGDKTLAKYVIKEMGGAKYLFMEWMSGDVTIRGMKPEYYVLARGETPPEKPQAKTSPFVTDSPPAFVDDPEVIGPWESVDFVVSVDEFAPSAKKWKGDLYLKGLEFLSKGDTSGPWQWSKGTLYHPGDKSLGNYVIKEMDGAKYLFMEWISGDVTIRGQKPRYYVLKKAAPETTLISRAGLPSIPITRPDARDGAKAYLVSVSESAVRRCSEEKS